MLDQKNKWLLHYFVQQPVLCCFDGSIGLEVY